MIEPEMHSYVSSRLGILVAVFRRLFFPMLLIALGAGFGLAVLVSGANDLKAFEIVLLVLGVLAVECLVTVLGIARRIHLVVDAQTSTLIVVNPFKTYRLKASQIERIGTGQLVEPSNHPHPVAVEPSNPGVAAPVAFVYLKSSDRGAHAQPLRIFATVGGTAGTVITAPGSTKPAIQVALEEFCATAGIPCDLAHLDDDPRQLGGPQSAEPPAEETGSASL